MSIQTNRRTMLRWLVQYLLINQGLTAASRSLFDPGQWGNRSPQAVRQIYTRRYRVHATISLLSIQILSKDGVGAACASVEHLRDGPRTVTALQFAGGSWPHRLKGFNRFGMTQEIVCEEGRTIRESAYLSFITSSPERSFTQARNSIGQATSDTTLAVARGSAGSTGHNSALYHQIVPVSTTWADCPELMDVLRQQPLTPPEQPNAPGVLVTFLHAVRGRMTGACTEPRRHFLHNAKLYTLHTTVSNEGDMSLLTGSIQSQSGRTESEFRVWFKSGDSSGLPVRIDFRPRNFLRLVFEQDESAGGPTLRCLIPQENT